MSALGKDGKIDIGVQRPNVQEDLWNSAEIIIILPNSDVLKCRGSEVKRIREAIMHPPFMIPYKANKDVQGALQDGDDWKQRHKYCWD